MNAEEIERRFYSHPTGAALESLCNDIREEYTALAKTISTLTKCRESSLAITKLEESLCWALAAIIKPPTKRTSRIGGFRG